MKDKKGLSSTMRPEQNSGYSRLTTLRGRVGSCPGPPGPLEPPAPWRGAGTGVCSQELSSGLHHVSFSRRGFSSAQGPPCQPGCPPPVHFNPATCQPWVLHMDFHCGSTCCFLVGFPSGFFSVLGSPSSHPPSQSLHCGMFARISLGWVSGVGAGAGECLVLLPG